MGIDRAVPVAVPAHILSGIAMMNQPGNLHNPHDASHQPSGQAAPKPIQRQFQRRSLTGLRLQKHADYQRAYNASRKRQSASMSWFLAPRQPQPDQGSNPGPRVGLTAGKVLGKAHERNRIKRRMREALRLHTALLPQGCDLILHPRRSVLSLDFAKLEAEVVRILQQAKAEAARGPVQTPSPRPVRQSGPAKPAL
ncbi:MAG: ribonuclease P protein component [Terracidiphilus sp.]|jgi:ribonuclease P protein component